MNLPGSQMPPGSRFNAPLAAMPNQQQLLQIYQSLNPQQQQMFMQQMQQMQQIPQSNQPAAMAPPGLGAQQWPTPQTEA